MTAQLLSQVILPIVLAFIMLAMGLSLQLKQFSILLKQPSTALLGIVLQMLLLPALAWLVIWLLELPQLLAAGLLLVALAPGGATSNLFSYLCKGNLALSIALTALVSLLTPMTMALMVALNFSWLGLDTQHFALPFLPTFMQLAIVTVVPVSLGLLGQHFWPNFANSIQPWVKRIGAGTMMVLVVLLAIFNWQALPDVVSQATLAVMTLVFLALAAGYGIAKLSKQNEANSRTIMIEVGIQNAGTAMMVAFSILQNPALAMIPLLYGIAMNIPAFLTVWHFNYHDKRNSSSMLTAQ